MHKGRSFLHSVGSISLGTPFKGIYRDLKHRLPYYVSDWTDGFNYRVIPATIYMYFTNLLPAIAFAQDMFDRTHNSYGVNEVLLSSAMGGIVFGLFAGQPLCIVGVTGPITVFNYTVYRIVVPKGIPYFPFMAWVCLWSMVMHFFIAAFNWVNGLKYVTRYSCDIFGMFICIIYIQKGIQIANRQFDYQEDPSAYLQVILGLLILIFGIITVVIGKYSGLFHHTIRKFIADYGLPLTVVFFTGFAYFPGRLKMSDLQRLPITESFEPTTTTGGRTHGWFIHFWNISVGNVFLAIPFALLLTVLFYFDHNVSSLICQGTEFPLKKPASFHWDFFLLGITTGLAGILGIPAPNGLIPQAPLHTMSLCVVKYKREGIDRNENINSNNESDTSSQSCETNELTLHHRLLPLKPYNAAVVEQRVSNTVQGLLILGTMARPLLIVLGLVPQGVLCGLFWIMGVTGLMGNGLVHKLKFIFHDDNHVGPYEPLLDIQKRKNLYIFTTLGFLGVGAEVAITETIAAVGFPAVLLLTVLVGWLIPRMITDSDDMALLDGPTGSEMTLRNLSKEIEDSDMDSGMKRERSRASSPGLREDGLSPPPLGIPNGSILLRHRSNKLEGTNGDSNYTHT